MQQHRVLVFLFITLLATLLYFGCGGEKKEVEVTPQPPIKIGAVFSVTGSAAKLGGPEKNTALMITEKINAAGGINGRQIEVIVEDDQGDPEKTQNAVKKLITRDGVVAIIGPTRSGCGFAAAPICEETGVPLISCAAAYTQLYMDKDPTKPMLKYVFKTPQNDSHCARTILNHCKENGRTKIAIITGTTGFGAPGRVELLKWAKELGITIVADETYPPEASDLTPQLTSIRAKNPQAIINWSIVPAQGLIAGQIKQLGMNVQLYQSHGFGNKGYITPAAEGVIFPAGRLLVIDDISPDDVQYGVLTSFKKEYEETFGEEVSTFAGHAYDALHMVIKTIEAQGTERDNIRSGLESTHFVGTAGVFHMTPTDHCGLSDDAFVLVTVKDGMFRTLDSVQ